MALSVLRDIFGRTEFRSCQEDIVSAALKKEDCLVLLPTGHGKSLCFQLPAVMAGQGFTLVISPLLALMANQVQALKELGVDAFCVNSQMPLSERKLILDKLETGNTRGGSLLYASPELCLTPEFRRYLDKCSAKEKINRIVVDEAHCCVEWGRQFRAEYARLGELRDSYPNIPLMALTGTASAEMRERIVQALHLAGPRLRVFSTLMYRPNLHFEVRYVEDPEDRLNDALRFLKVYRSRIKAVYGNKFKKGTSSKSWQGFGIIYCRSRATTEVVAKELRNHGFGAHAFHAKLDTKDKHMIMSQWVAGNPRYSIVVATIAFGMGVDKPDTRFVLHFEMPANIEAFVQHSGRAGRDGKAARTILYYSQKEHAICTKFAKESGDQHEMAAARALLQYATATDRCRHQLVTEYFDGAKGAMEAKCDFACDFCKAPKRLKARYEHWMSSL